MREKSEKQLPLVGEKVPGNGPQGNFPGRENVLYLDWGSVYMGAD